MKEFNFKNNLVPNLKKPINKKIKAMYFGEHKIDGFVINNYTGLMQFIEFLTA